MIETKAISVVLDKKLVDEAETVLKELGISPAAAIAMLYSQIVKSNGLPFDSQLPPSEEDLTPEELDAELEKGVRSIERGDFYTQEEMHEIIEKEFKS